MNVGPHHTCVEQMAKAVRIRYDDTISRSSEQCDVPVHDIRGAGLTKQLTDPAIDLVVERNDLDPFEREWEARLLGSLPPCLRDHGAGGTPDLGGTQQAVDRLVVPVDRDQCT